jgi:hypothetical protein
MVDYKGPENIYWLFSSSAQAIAAFIGFLAAGFFFSYDRMDKHVEKDETLEDIYAEIKIKYYNRIIILFILTASSISLSLAMTYLNGFDLGIYGIVLRLLVSTLNLLTIIWAIVFILFIINPSKVKKTADILIKENVNISETVTDNTMTGGEFIDKFVKLEKILRQLAIKYDLSDEIDVHNKKMSLYDIIRYLNLRQVINNSQVNELLEVNKIRNLAAHGEIHNVESKLGQWVERIENDLEVKLND